MGFDVEWVLVNIVGNFGVLLILIAFFMLQLEKLKSDGLFYLLLNLCGALCIGVSLIYNFNLPSAVIEICWAIISIYGLAKLALRRLKRNRASEGASSSNTSVSSVLESGSVQSEDRTNQVQNECVEQYEGLSDNVATSV